MQEQIDDFIAAMTQEDCQPSDSSCIIADDEIHRYHVQGDKPKSENGSYKLAVSPDGFAFGWFVWWKNGINHAYNSKPKRGITPEERAEFKTKSDAARKQAETKRKEAAKQAADRASQAWESAAQDGTTEYTERKKIQLHGCRINGGQLLVPMRRDGELVSMQYIHADGRKLFEKGGDQAGAYFSIAKNGDDLSTMAIVEGFSTGASVREATGWPVVVAFNAGGLKACALSISERHPNARIVVCGDNDHATTNAKGEPWNVGLEKAQQAAVAIGGAQVVVPETADGITDWNDVHCRDGIEAVAAGVMVSVVAVKPDMEPDTVGPSEDDVEPLSVVRPLGHNRQRYYFFPKVGGQVVEFSAGALGNIQNLYQLAPRRFWDMHYNPEGKASDSSITSLASANLMEECQRQGVFQLDNARGVGVWLDEGQVVVNCGDVLVGDGFKVRPSEYTGKNVYESGLKVIDIDCTPLTDGESMRVRSILNKLSWKRSQYADLLAGWIVVASVGSALSWRPHIIVTGQKQAGKSTVMDFIVKGILGDIAIKRGGSTTEAGVRKAIGISGRPFVIDEFESENQSEKNNVEKIMSLIRKSSSGEEIENANTKFMARSCFCTAAINPMLHHGADVDRHTVLELVPDGSAGSRERYSRLISDIHNTFTPEFSKRLLKRTVDNMDVLLANIKTFTAAAAAAFGNQRQGDQLGPMLAGCYMLTTTRQITRDQADAWIAEKDWGWHDAQQDMTDAEKLVMHIMAARVRFDSMGRGMESSIGELVSRANDIGDTEQKTADAALRGYGLKIDGDWLLVANTSPQMSKILRDTPWSVWRRTLGDYDGSGNYDNKPVSFGAGQISKVVSLPLTRVLGLEAPLDDTTPEYTDNEELIPFG